MCCLFTCCGWMVDLIQRLWTFTMSCCISSSVCCVLLSSSMSGIALGYNYSLAEYIDLKETNVSVYLKRGVFDDEIADDFEFRRSGHLPVAGHLASDNLMTGAPDFSVPMGSGRRLDNSVVESDDPRRFEGSLMRLTAHAPFPGTSTTVLDEINEHQFDGQKFAPGSLDALKVIHNVVNARKSGNVNERTTKPRATISNIEDRFRARYPNGMNPNARRLLGPDGINVNALNPARLAVPGKDIAYPRDPELFKKKTTYSDFEMRKLDMEVPMYEQPYPSPIPVEPAPIRPTRVPTIRFAAPPTKTARREPAREQLEVNAIPADKSMKEFKEKMLLDKIQAPSDIEKPKESQRSESEDYDEEIKGLPVRRKRRDLTKDSSHKNIRSEKVAPKENDIINYVTNIYTHETIDKFSNGGPSPNIGEVNLRNTITANGYVVNNAKDMEAYSSILMPTLLATAKDLTKQKSGINR